VPGRNQAVTAAVAWPEVRASSRFLHVSATRFAGFSRVWARLHARLYDASGGRLLRRWFGAPVIVLETVGRRSATRRRTPLIHLRDGERVVVVAANAGSPTVPAWWHNLRAAGRATIVVSGDRIAVRPRLVEGEERERLWRAFADRYAGLDDYAAMTDRELPVVVLEPDAGG
jgi:deazaflavin-dependent oxidoreductase (nitroreductase family)